jgi:glucose-1-phosphate cytidylyltransferase
VHPRNKYGLLTLGKNNLATRFIEKPVLKEWVNGGFMVFMREAFRYFKKGEYEHKALMRLVKKKQLSIYIHDRFWYCMDTYNDVDDLNKFWRKNPKWKVWS